MLRALWLSLLLTPSILAQAFTPSSDRPTPLAREFRAAWIATAYNIDWPSKQGLSATEQQAELRRILDTVVSLRMNAVIFQVRPMGDAFYQSSHEPWSHFLTGTMGRSPGYDPLEFCLREAHARGLEVHAWFNPFRALCNNDQATAANHITRTHRHLIKRHGTQTWCDPAFPESRERALAVILDVVRRYNIDGVHLDDYFYPYPKKNLVFRDGKSPAQRRAYINSFIKSLYQSVKKAKPWVRVGISPFGIWRPGVPRGIEAGLDSCEDLAGDSRLWLQEGWVDYLAPQLYWRIEPQKQSFPKLLEWWRDQGKRPVWPGIATQRIGGPEDGRRATEISRQISLSRQIGRNWHGHIHWSVSSLVDNQGGISKLLQQSYTQPAVVPPMPWLNSSLPAAPRVSAMSERGKTHLRWHAAGDASRVAIQIRQKSRWHCVAIVPATRQSMILPECDGVAVSAIDRYGNTSAPKVLTQR